MAKHKINRIKLVLIENDKGNKDLAKHLGVTPTAVSRWCTNDAQPSLNTLVEIAKYLKVDVRDLLNPTLNK
ncbi:MAG TPA: helix-turn-helix transcriptional regulator [Chryseolinea sp.]